MLVKADAVEGQRGRVFELVEVVVVDAMAELRVVEVRRDVDVDAVVALPEVVRQVRVWHEVEGVDLHGRGSPLGARLIAYGGRRKYTSVLGASPLRAYGASGDRFPSPFGRGLGRGRGHSQR